MLVQLQGSLSVPAVVLVHTGQAVAAALVVHLARAGAGRAAATPAAGSRIDVVIICTVLGLVAAQLVAAAAVGGGGLAALVGPTVDVAILGMLLRFVVTRRRLRRSSWLALCAAVLTTLYDLLAAVQHQEVALPANRRRCWGPSASCSSASQRCTRR